MGQEVQLLFQDMTDCGSACIYGIVSSLGGPPTYWWQKREEVFPPLVPSWLKHHSHLLKGWSPGTSWLSLSICSGVEGSVFVFKFLWSKCLWVFHQFFTYNNLRGTLWLSMSNPIKHDWNIEAGMEDMARIKGSNPLSPNVESSIEGSALKLVSCKMAKERKSNSLFDSLFHTVKILLKSRKHWKGSVLLYTDAMLTLMNYSG